MNAESRLRPIKADEHLKLEKLAHSRTAPARLNERAKLILAVLKEKTIVEISRVFQTSRMTIYHWIHRFNDQGISGLDDLPRSGRPQIYTADKRAEVLGIALTSPKELGLPFCCWSLDRLQAYLSDKKGIQMRRSRIDEILIEEGLRWRKQETWFGARVDPEFKKKGHLSKRSIRRRLKMAA